MNQTDQVVSVSVTGPMEPVHLKTYCEEIKDRLKQQEKISQIEVLGFSNHEYRVEIPFYNLMRFGLSVSDVKNVVASQNLDMPAGSIESTDSDILIRFSEERKSIRELQDLVIISSAQGKQIRLGDIATIQDRFMLDEQKILFDGKRAGILQINKTKSEDALRIMDKVTRFLAAEKLKAPPGVHFAITQNISKIVRDRLQMLIKNGVEGLLLVFLAMVVFFPLRFSFWVSMGLPVSFF